MLGSGRAGWNTSGPLAASSSAQIGRSGLLRRIELDTQPNARLAGQLAASVGRGHEDDAPQIRLGLEEEHRGELVDEFAGVAWIWSIGLVKIAFQSASPLGSASILTTWPPVLLPRITI